LETYFNDMLNAYDVTTATNYYNKARASVTNSYWKLESSKNLVRAMVEICHQYAIKYFNGAYQGVAPDVKAITGTSFTAISGRSMATCKVDWKAVWRSAVIGGMVTGTGGAYAGATGGTVVLPLVGTVTGAVGGAVFGFAAGFSSGATMAVAEQVIFACVFSQALYEDACLNIDFSTKNPDLCYDRRAFYKLIN
jgi:hypothetical protein